MKDELTSSLKQTLEERLREAADIRRALELSHVSKEQFMRCCKKELRIESRTREMLLMHVAQLSHATSVLCKHVQVWPCSALRAQAIAWAPLPIHTNVSFLSHQLSVRVISIYSRDPEYRAKL